uniref:Uncharacterized protein n=1 Tax=Siphoviridae sp. ctGa111 TaxID=2825413 RepID=A0A8S5VDF3_9CAUD|nr:MAG TPA: hypothetical protein [Siphoviridae sp. ctGa111]
MKKMGHAVIVSDCLHHLTTLVKIGIQNRTGKIC